MKAFFTSIFFLLFSFAFSQHQSHIDFKEAHLQITLDTLQNSITGKILYQFEVLEKVDSIFLDAKNISFQEVLVDGKPIKYKNNNKTIAISKKWKSGKKHTLTLSYTTRPKQTVYFMGWKNKQDKENNQIWTQGQGKYTSHWVPSFDDMSEKVVFNTSITFAKPYTVIANGSLVKKEETETAFIWHYQMQHPMSSYLLAFAIGKYTSENFKTTTGVPLELYYMPKDKDRVEPTYRYTLKLFSFLEKEIGVLYPWTNYKTIPVRDFFYGGMENTTATIFSDEFMIDSVAFKDKNFVNVNAHELAHQWFGNLVTEKDSKEHWLHEGFATYYAYLAQQDIFGDEFFYWLLFDKAKELFELSNNGKGESIINPKASSLTFYEKGALALYMLRKEVGDTAFKTAVTAYLEKNKYVTVTVADFLQEIENRTEKSLETYKKVWVEGTLLDYDHLMENLADDLPSIKAFLGLKKELSTSKENNQAIIKRYWKNNTSLSFKQHIIQQFASSFSEDFINEILETEEVLLRQSIVQANIAIPQSLKEQFTTILEDNSYTSKELALYKLWVHFPEDRFLFLDKTADVIGFPDKNVRLLWLTLAIITEDYNNDEKQKYSSELMSYTAPSCNFQVRQSAFSLLKETVGFSNDNLKDLLEGCHHPSWQFKKYCRALLEELLKNNFVKRRFQNLSKELEGEELDYLNKQLEIL